MAKDYDAYKEAHNRGQRAKSEDLKVERAREREREKTSSRGAYKSLNDFYWRERLRINRNYRRHPIIKQAMLWCNSFRKWRDERKLRQSLKVRRDKVNADFPKWQKAITKREWVEQAVKAGNKNAEIVLRGMLYREQQSSPKGERGSVRGVIDRLTGVEKGGGREKGVGSFAEQFQKRGLDKPVRQTRAEKEAETKAMRLIPLDALAAKFGYQVTGKPNERFVGMVHPGSGDRITIVRDREKGAVQP